MKILHRFCLRTGKFFSGLLAALFPLLARADDSWNFPTPVTPIARDTLEIHIDGVSPGQRVLLVDDLLATGGTIEACCNLIEQAKATVAGCAFVIELSDLDGAARLQRYELFSLIKY